MARDINCDICNNETAVQMLNNLIDGNVLAIGAGCLPVFYGQVALSVMEAGEHKGPAGKCQACRRMHERMTTPPAAPDIPDDLVTAPEGDRIEESQAVDTA